MEKARIRSVARVRRRVRVAPPHEHVGRLRAGLKEQAADAHAVDIADDQRGQTGGGHHDRHADSEHHSAGDGDAQRVLERILAGRDDHVQTGVELGIDGRGRVSRLGDINKVERIVVGQRRVAVGRRTDLVELDARHAQHKETRGRIDIDEGLFGNHGRAGADRPRHHFHIAVRLVGRVARVAKKGHRKDAARPAAHLRVARDPLLLRTRRDGAAHDRVGEKAAGRVAVAAARVVLPQVQIAADGHATQRRGLRHGPLHVAGHGEVLDRAPEIVERAARIVVIAIVALDVRQLRVGARLAEADH